MVSVESAGRGLGLESVRRWASGRSLRDWAATVLTVACAVGVTFAAANAFGETQRASLQTEQVYAWRAMGFLMFDGVFVLLAIAPRRYPGLWELTITNKALLTLWEASMIPSGASDAASTAIADTVVVAFLAAAYVLARGYRAWMPRGARD